MNKIKVGVLGATGMVGQRYVKLLENHPWFEVTYIAASPRSAGKLYKEAVENRWLIGADIPATTAELMVEDANLPEKAIGKCQFVFSALELPKKDDIKALEAAYTAEGIPEGEVDESEDPDEEEQSEEENHRVVEILVALNA